MVDGPIGSYARGIWIALLALSIGCASSSATRPFPDGGGDEDTGGESDGELETDSAMGDATDDMGGGEEDAPDEDGASDGGTDGGVTDHDLCVAGCTVTAAVVACPEPSSACIRRCDLVFGRGICLPALRALLQCQTAAGPEAYECVATGGVTTKPGVCAAETKAKADCASGDAGM